MLSTRTKCSEHATHALITILAENTSKVSVKGYIIIFFLMFDGGRNLEPNCSSPLKVAIFAFRN
jgi:hypothetical protein